MADFMYIRNAMVQLNDEVDNLNEINVSYQRSCGTLFMASKQMEDRIEGYLDGIEKSLVEVRKATDEQIEEIVNITADEYRAWLDQVEECVSENRKAVKEARDFLARYGQ